MATLDDIVKVDIELATKGISKADFGTPLIAGTLMSFAERVRSYSDYDSAIEDKLPQSILNALNEGFSQSPRPAVIKVGRLSVSKATISGKQVIALGVYSFKVGDFEYSFTASESPTLASIATGLAAVVADHSGSLITAVASGDTLQISWKSQSNISNVELGENLEWVSLSGSEEYSGIQEDLAAIEAEDSSWYGLCLVDRILDLQKEAAKWIEANTKLFFAVSADSNCWSATSTTDLLSVMRDNQYYRTITIAHKDGNTQYPDVAWACDCFNYTPGSETWALKSLAAITPSKFTKTQQNVIHGKNGNTFEFYHENVALTMPGKVAAGEWVDVIRFRDWLKDNIQTEMTSMLINRPKLPYTDSGIQTAVNCLRASLQKGQNVGGIAPDEVDSNNENVPGFEIAYPRAADLTANEKASRILNLGFRARLAGAIHLIEIEGTLAYTL